MMTFLAPLTLSALALVALPVVIHLLVRRRARRLDFPSLRFLRETPSFRFFPRRIRRPLLLALRVAAIVLLVLGLARPLLTLHARAGGAALHLILMDASLSMRARGRAESARERARSIVEKLAPGDRAAVIAFSSAPVLLAAATADRRKLLEAINEYRPGGGAADYGAALAEAGALLRGESGAQAQADLISDFQQSGFEDRSGARAWSSAGLGVVAYPVGEPFERNAFLIDETARSGERGLELAASEMLAETEGRGGARRSWTIVASEGASAGVEWRTEPNGQITGRLMVIEPDDFDADDERFFAFEPPREGRVLLLQDEGGASLYLGAALEAGASEQGRMRFTLERRRELPESAADLSIYSLVVLTLDGAPREGQLRALIEYARAGGTVWMCLGRELDATAWNAVAGTEEGAALPFEGLTRMAGDAVGFGAADAGAPSLRRMDESGLAALRTVRVRAGYAIAPRAAAETLLRWNDAAPALVSARVGGGEILMLGTSPERAAGDLGSSSALPALASSVARAKVAPSGPIAREIGTAVRLGVAPETDVKISDGGGRVFSARASELVRQPLSYFPEPGIYRLDVAGTTRFMAFNAPAAESERALATAEQLKSSFLAGETKSFAAAESADRRAAAEREGSAWRYFLCASLLFMLAELFVSVRGGGANAAPGAATVDASPASEVKRNVRLESR
ncbi:MAG TPA: BatA and WFA domain-containing protein [Pyrinomonadaceae bacterium]|jgi:hypothetical protein